MITIIVTAKQKEHSLSLIAGWLVHIGPLLRSLPLMTAPLYSRPSSAGLSDDSRDASRSNPRHRRLGTMRRECACDQISAMRTQEESESYRTRDYLADLDDVMMSDGDDSRGPIDESCRRKMCMWSSQVVDFFKFGSRESVHMASAYLDRFLSSSDEAAQRALMNRKEYQLFSMTALYLAIKIQETIEVDLSIMEKLSRGDYTAKDFRRAEVQLIRALRWKLNDPTPTEFVRRFVSLLPANVDSIPSSSSTLFSSPEEKQEHVMSDEYMIMDFARFQTEISVTDYSFVATKPSLIATASVLNAVDTIENLSLSNQQKQDFVHAIQDASEINIHSPEVRGVREKLKIRFNKSRGRSTICESDARSMYTYCSSGTGVALQRKHIHKAKASPRTTTAGVGDAESTGSSGSTESSPVCVRRVSVGARR